MTIELPDIEAVEKLSPAELRLELACALYERGRVGKVGGAGYMDPLIHSISLLGPFLAAFKAI